MSDTIADVAAGTPVDDFGIHLFPGRWFQARLTQQRNQGAPYVPRIPDSEECIKRVDDANIDMDVLSQSYHRATVTRSTQPRRTTLSSR